MASAKGPRRSVSFLWDSLENQNLAEKNKGPLETENCRVLSTLPRRRERFMMWDVVRARHLRISDGLRTLVTAEPLSVNRRNRPQQPSLPTPPVETKDLCFCWIRRHQHLGSFPSRQGSEPSEEGLRKPQPSPSGVNTNYSLHCSTLIWTTDLISRALY